MINSLPQNRDPVDPLLGSGDIAHRHQDQQAQEQHEADHVNKPFALGVHTAATNRFDQNKEQAPAIQRRQRQQVGDRPSGRQYRKEPAWSVQRLAAPGGSAGGAEA